MAENTALSVAVAPAHPNVATAPDISRLPPDALLNRRQMELLTGFKQQTFRAWALRGSGPTITTVEGHPRYLVRDVREWMGLLPERAAG